MPLQISPSGPRRTRPPLAETGILLCCAGLILCPLAGLILAATTGAEVWRALLWLELLLAACLCLLLWFGVFRPLRILLGELQREENAADARPAPYWIAPCIAPLMRRARNLRDTAERARLAMEERQENLRHTEKLALVGKLAAGVAHSIRNPLFLPHTGWKCFEHTGCMHYASQPSLSLSYRQHVATCLVAQEALVLPHVVGNALDAAHVAHVEFIAEADLARPHRAQHVHPAVRHCLLVAPSGEVAQRAGLSVSPPPIQLPTSSCPFQVSPLSFTYWQ